MPPTKRDERGQSLVIVLSLITLLFLLGSSLAVHASVALRTTRTSAGEGNDFYAADAATELGIWWQRNGKAGNPPAQTINGITTSTTVTSTPVAGGTCPASPTPDWISGMESGVFYKYVNNVTNVYTMPRPSDNGIPAGGWYDKGGDVTIVTTPVRTGTYALRVHSTASVGAYAATRFATPYPTSAVMRFSVRLDSLPTQDADLARLAVTGGTNYTVLHVFYKATTQKYALGWGWANPTLVQESTVTATTGTWASFDVRVSANNQNPRTADWYVNDISQPSLSATDTANATNVSTWYVGYPTQPATDWTGYFDDIVLSRDPNDFPLGDIKIVPLSPNAMGTSNTPTNFQNDDGTAINANSWQRVDEIPMGSLTDYIKMVTAGQTSYIEFNFPDTTETCPRGASIVAAVHSAGTSANGFALVGYPSPIGCILFGGDVSYTSPAWYTQSILTNGAVNCATLGAGPWTQAAINSTTVRVGLTSDVNPVPYLDALLMELAYRPMNGGPATITIAGSAGGSTVNTSYSDAGAAAPTL
ncbi:MAG: hypothetical protein E6J17_06725, partial [Chloroflexi bacterium]